MPEVSRSTPPPNIIYILADDMGYGDISCLNPSAAFQTPHLDRLAAGGLRFTDAHASSAVCTPSRYSILTGRYNWRSWLKRGVTIGYSKPVIEPGRMTVASLLKSQGYATGCIGKWHLGWTWPKTGEAEDAVDYTRPIPDGPTSHGFDTFYGISASLDMPPYVYIENDRPTAIPDRFTPGSTGKAYWREGSIAPDFKHETVLPHLTQKALEFIDQHANGTTPFFLYFPLPAPHTPILPTPAFRGKSGTNEYGDFCLQVDDVVGQVMATLDRHGITDNTILIFTSDNGCSPAADFAELARCGHNPSHIFRGHKADIYEGGHRVPLIVRWPARIKSGRKTDETVCLSDLLATCAEIVGSGLPDNAGEDSISNLPLWDGNPLNGALREATVHHSIDGSFSIRKGHWKLEMCAGSGGWSSPRPGPECDGLPPIQLYDLRMDIGERKNLFREHPAIVESMKALLTLYVEQGRSTPGKPQGNAGGTSWNELWWMLTRNS
ncbi:MAG: arylsulfatase [Lentisphaerae bacterium RIFOXYC12_FULL_60_16]|nr:MAG: arylsulfatase [Lentisphaerae bacterium RIFOXYC12_FULL_60_16]